MDELKVIKDYFPKSYNKFTRMYGLVNSKNVKKSIDVTDAELTDYIQTYTKGLNLKVNYIKATEVDAFTIPSYIDTDLDVRSSLISYPIINDLYTINVMYYKLLKADIDGFASNGITTFTHNLPNGFVLETFQSSRFFSLLSNDIRGRFAVTLHEIGHWHSCNPYLFESIFSLIKHITRIILGGAVVGSVFFGDLWDVPILIVILAISQVLCFFMINYIRSLNEENCDKFAKKLGYGEDLSRVMFAFNYGSNDFNNSVNKEKFLKYTNQFSFKIKDLIHRLMHGYPSDGKRIEIGITENILNLSLETQLKDFVAPLDRLFAGR